MYYFLFLILKTSLNLSLFMKFVSCSMCSAESQKRSAKCSNFKDDNRVLPLYKLSLCDASWRIMRIGFSIIQWLVVVQSWFELKKLLDINLHTVCRFPKFLPIVLFLDQFIILNLINLLRKFQQPWTIRQTKADQLSLTVYILYKDLMSFDKNIPISSCFRYKC